MISMMDISAYSAALSAVLLLGLIVMYARMYRDTRAQFSLGLTIFALVLFAQNILAVYSFIIMSNLVGTRYQRTCSESMSPKSWESQCCSGQRFAENRRDLDQTDTASRSFRK